MRRRSFINQKEVRKTIKSHLVFVSVLLIAAFIGIASDVDVDTNTTLLGMVLAVGAIFALSLFNAFVIDLFNDLNERWTILNYCVPSMIVLSLVFVFAPQVDPMNVMSVSVAVLIADLCMYVMEKSNRPYSANN